MTSKDESLNEFIEMFRDLFVYTEQIEIIKNDLRNILSDEQIDVIFPILSAYKMKPHQATEICRLLRLFKAQKSVVY
jgi:hypothetical protein